MFNFKSFSTFSLKKLQEISWEKYNTRNIFSIYVYLYSQVFNTFNEWQTIIIIIIIIKQ